MRHTIPSERPLIGLSLSLCVHDIVAGRVAYEHVTKIVSGIRAPNDDVWLGVVEGYQESYWRDDPEQAAEVANRLRADGKLSMPRLGDEPRSPNIAHGHWVVDESEIVWDRY